MSEDEAAGLRKQLIRFHCISCDRPIDVQPHPFVISTTIVAGERSSFFAVCRQQPSLPVNQGMRPIQSPRPYTTYELDQIRQFQKRFDSFFVKLCQFHDSFFGQFLVSSLVVMISVAALAMYMQLCDNAGVHTRRHYPSNGNYEHSNSSV